MRVIIGTDRDLCTTTCSICKSTNIEIEDEDMHPYSATIVCKNCNNTTLIHGRMLDPYKLTYFYHEKGQSMNPGTVSEGRVYKHNTKPISFKAISNKYLLEKKD